MERKPLHFAEMMCNVLHKIDPRLFVLPAWHSGCPLLENWRDKTRTWSHGHLFSSIIWVEGYVCIYACFAEFLWVMLINTAKVAPSEILTILNCAIVGLCVGQSKEFVPLAAQVFFFELGTFSSHHFYS
jgi:hypothetical protein